MTKVFWTAKDWFKKEGSASLDKELKRIWAIKSKFRKKMSSLPEEVLNKYTLEQINLIVKEATEKTKAKTLGHARTLGFSQNITFAYTIKGESHQKSVLEQARDYLKLLFSTDFYIDRVITSTVSHNNGVCSPTGYNPEDPKHLTPKPLPKVKQTDRAFYYDYLEHLAQ